MGKEKEEEWRQREAKEKEGQKKGCGEGARGVKERADE